MPKQAINHRTKNDFSNSRARGEYFGAGVKLRTIFMGTSEFAAHILESLISADYSIVSVYTQPDKKAGRDQEIRKSAIKILAEKNKLPVFQPAKFTDSVIEELKKQKPDLIILAAYGKIIPASILCLPGFGALNVHASLLPKYRGPSPIQNALLNGETETGVTIMLMDEKIDTGEILSQKSVMIDKHENSAELSLKMSKVAAPLLLETLPLWVERKIQPQKQDDSQATLCQLIEKSDGKIIWSDEAKNIYNLFRAFTPWPGIFTYWQGENGPRRIKLNKISFLEKNPETKHHVGEVFQIGEKIGIQCNYGVIILEEIQLEGKVNMKSEDFINGYQNFVGSILK
ncbi:MAG: methionyl-tRNA formyltransferase [Candidatus Moranbacteria bacterium CG_4_9_14_3_um_filter_42_9]|nr:MAG: methionyl-tRNA formyltransferase [Candidatus Moranbacteria bacterium CG_4_9_14_3_um_filter_42_9]